MKNFALFLTFVSSLLLVVAQDSNDICLSVRRNDIRPEILTGRIGKAGPRGLKGEPGQCACDPHEITQLRQQIGALDEKIQRLAEKNDEQTRRACVGGLIYKDVCIKLPYVVGRRVQFAEVERICASMNSTVAEVVNDVMYDRVFQYVNSTWVGSGTAQWTYVWLRSTFEPVNNPNNRITLSSGEKITLSKWFPGRPYKGTQHATRVNLMFEVSLRFRGANNRNNHLWNVDPNSSWLPLCQYRM
ncbi:unnamed protein product [Clavelina lepadiformis]|uniref:C-type lectin domain-containing protein n=1 Tax=Clavelina lepadiformis TaxID=159417 RepID=A0ABP0F1W1_CLALP